MWFVKEGLEAKQELSEYQVVGMSSAAPEKRGGKKSLRFLEIREADKSRLLLCGIYLKGARRSESISTKARQRLGKFHSVEEGQFRAKSCNLTTECLLLGAWHPHTRWAGDSRLKAVSAF